MTTETNDRQLSMSRLLNAPIALVWDVWTNPDHIKNWWGPNGFTNTIFKMDVKPGGEWDFIMHGPDGRDYKNKSIFRKVVKHKKLVYEHLSGPKFLATILFEERGDKTQITWTMLFETREEFVQTVKTFRADEGLKQNAIKLDGYLRKISSQKEMTIVRVINAPREEVFKAWIDTEQLKKWWGPKGFTAPVCKVDATPGGQIYIDMKSADGRLYPMDGEFHEIVEPERIVFTSAALDEKGERLFEVLNTVTFEDQNGKTKLTLHAAVSRIRTEGSEHIAGMNEGWSQSLDRLNELAVSSKGDDVPLVFERTYNAPIEQVWQAITNVNQMRRWYFDLKDFKAEPGFEFQFYAGDEKTQWLHLCRVTEVVPGKKISYTWRYDGYPGNSEVSFELFDEGAQTRLVLTHKGLESFEPGKHPELAKNNFKEGWTYFTGKALREFLEGAPA